MKKLTIAALVLCIALAQPASAHVLITDRSNTRGAILHLTPDDDPVAGQEATLYFDTQTQTNAVSVSIQNKDGEVSSKTMGLDGTLATTQYVFPAQGVYRLTFTAKSDNRDYTFTQNQRITRGKTASALDKPTYTWAEITLIICGILFLLLLFTVWDRRKDIARQSKF